ncbi:MAG: hypothetical protein V4722_22330 [Bacteroidota bacterium]
MKKFIIFGMGLLALQNSYTQTTQRVGIGTTNPLARFSVDSSIMVDQSNTNIGTLQSGSLIFGSDAAVGIARSTVIGSGARSGLGFYTNEFRRMLIDSTGKVGINTSFPAQPLHVNGNIYASGNIGINVLSPQYDLHVALSARFGGYVGINADPLSPHRLRVAGDAYFETSNVGINIAPSVSYSLYASGSVRFTGDTRIDGILNPNNALAIGNNASIDGSLTVGGRGIIRGNNSAQWRLVRLTVAYAGGLSANSDLIGATFAYSLGGGTIAGILVGPVVEAGSGSSNLGSIGLIPVNMTNTTCNFLIMNASSTAANMGTNENPTRWQLTILVFD